MQASCDEAMPSLLMEALQSMDLADLAVDSVASSAGLSTLLWDTADRSVAALGGLYDSRSLAVHSTASLSEEVPRGRVRHSQHAQHAQHSVRTPSGPGRAGRAYRPP